MRSSPSLPLVRLGLLAGSLLATSAFALACEDDGAPLVALPDAGGGLDAAVPTPQGPPDAYVPPDAPAPTGPVSVRVLDGATPVAGVRVVFNDASGAVVETLLTGADGKATCTVATPPAMASALLGSGGERRIVTWTAVQPGDALETLQTPTGTPLGAMAATLPFYEGASQYSFAAGNCFGNPQPGNALRGVVELGRGCAVGGQVSFLVFATSGGTVLAHAYKKGNPLPAAGTTAELTGLSAWAPPTTVTVTTTGLPPETGSQLRLFEIADGVGFYVGSSRNAGGAELFPTATGFAEAHQATLIARSGQSVRGLAQRAAPAPAITLDASKLLPAVTALDLVRTNAARPVVSWVGATAATDGGVVVLNAYGNDRSVRWTLAVPPGATTVTAPALPPEGADWLAASGDAYQQPEVAFADAPGVDAAAFRQRHAVLLGATTSPFDALYATFPTNGTYTVTGWAQAD